MQSNVRCDGGLKGQTYGRLQIIFTLATYILISCTVLISSTITEAEYWTPKESRSTHHCRSIPSANRIAPHTHPLSRKRSNSLRQRLSLPHPLRGYSRSVGDQAAQPNSLVDTVDLNRNCIQLASSPDVNAAVISTCSHRRLLLNLSTVLTEIGNSTTWLLERMRTHKNRFLCTSFCFRRSSGFHSHFLPSLRGLDRQ